MVDLDPTDTTAYANLATAFSMQKRHLEEIRSLKKVLMFDPENKELRSALSNAYFHLGEFDEALNCALCVIELDEKDPQAYCNLGSIHAAQNMTEEAIEAFKKAIEMDPEYSLPHTNLGSLYGTAGRVESAIKEFKKAISLNSGDAQAWLNLYHSYKDIGRQEDAAKAYEQYEKLTKEVAPGGGKAEFSGVPGGVSTTGDTASE